MPPRKGLEKRQLERDSDDSDHDTPRPSKRTAQLPDPDLPQSTAITFDQSEWLEQFKEPYRNAIKPKGTKKESATEYVYTTLTVPFIQKFFPQLTKEQVHRFKDFQFKSIYNWLNNHSHRDENASKPAGSVQRFVVEWYWYADNKKEIRQQWREYCRDNKKDLYLSVHQFRSFVLDLFGKQSPEIQLRYKNRTEELKQNAASRKELDAESVETALKDGLRRLTALGKGLESKYGIALVAHLGTPVEKSMRVVQAGSNTGLQFIQGERGKTIGTAFGDWLIERFGGPQDQSGSPLPAVIPDRTDNNHPMIPDVSEDIVTLALVRSWVRTFWSGCWQYDGGHGQVPYSLIAENPDLWVDPRRCPAGVPFKESGQLNLAQCLTWVKYLSGRRNGTVDKDSEFGFRQILTANLDTFPICPEVSERTQFVRNGRPVWLVRFSRLVEKPQNKKPIYYKRNCWLYFYHCEHERDPTTSMAPGLAHWNDLPTRPIDANAGNGRFSTDEVELIKSWFKDCEDRVKTLVDDLMAEVNVMEDRLPIWTENGLWERIDDEESLPLLLPESPPGENPRAGLDFMREFWVQHEYFVTPTKKTPIEATHHFLEVWVQESLTGGPGFHTKSETHVGGSNGNSWRIRALLKYLASIGGAIPSTHVSPPSAVPVQYDTTRLSIHLWDAVILWLNMWLSALIQSNLNLASSSSERCAPPIERGPEDGGDDGEDLQAGNQGDKSETPTVLTVDIVTPDPNGPRRPKRVAGSKSKSQSKPRTGPALPPTSDELDDLQQIDSDYAEHGTDEPGSIRTRNLRNNKGGPANKPRRKGKEKVAGQGGDKAAAEPPKSTPVASGESSQALVQPTLERSTLVEGNDKSDGVLESIVRSRMASKPAQMAALKVQVTRELEEEGEFWVIERVTPPTTSVGKGEPPKWDTPRCALVEKISLFKNPLNTLDPSTLKPSLLKFLEDSKALVVEYLSLEAEYNLPYGKSCFMGSIVRANDSAHNFPLLDQAIWQHAYHYAKCQSWWNGDLGDIFGDFHVLYAEGSTLLCRIHDLAAKGETCGLTDETLDLAELRTSQMKTYWRHGWKLLGLAKIWVNKHQECWLWSKEAWLLPDKVRLVNDLIEWETQTASLLAALEVTSEKDWTEARYPPMLRPPSSWFLFGNPGPNAVDEAAKAQLAVAKKELEECRASGEAEENRCITPVIPAPDVNISSPSTDPTRAPQQVSDGGESHKPAMSNVGMPSNQPESPDRHENSTGQEATGQIPMDLDPPLPLPTTIHQSRPAGVEVENPDTEKAGGAGGPGAAVEQGGVGGAGEDVAVTTTQTKAKAKAKAGAKETIAAPAQSAGSRTRRKQVASSAGEPVVRRSSRPSRVVKR